MKKFKLFLTILLGISVVFVSCKDPEIEHNHNFSEKWEIDEYYHWKKCSCGEIDFEAEHTIGDWKVTQEPTEETEGNQEGKCTVCPYKATEVIAKLHKHKFSERWLNDATYHWHASTCGHDIIEGKTSHSFGVLTAITDPTDTEDGLSMRVCNVCNYEQIIAIPLNFVFIPAGKFMMGSNEGQENNKPVHEVTITKPFYMGKYEVSQGEYEKYCTYTGSSPSSTYGAGGNYPAYFVSWYDILVYCNKRSIAEGLTPCYSISGNTDPSKWGTVPTSSNSIWNAVVCDWEANGYRLPTEAEWEYAARAGDNTVDSLIWSGTSSESKLSTYAWYNKDSSKNKFNRVTDMKPNAFGLYNMSGNVFEICWNWSTSSYHTSECGNDPTGASTGTSRIIRGGCFYSTSSSCAVSYRYEGSPYHRSSVIGFRVVRSAVVE